MAKFSSLPTTKTIGLDLGDRMSTVTELDVDGQVLERRTIATSRESLLRFFKERPRARVVLEATTHSPWVSRLLAEVGHDVLVAHPAAAARFLERYCKTDRRDSESLARMGRAEPELLKPLEHRTEQEQLDRAMIVARDHLVNTRKRLVGFVRGTLKAVGCTLSGLSTKSFGARAISQIPESMRDAMMPIIAVIAELSRQIHAYDKRIAAVAKERYPQHELLSQVCGVGTLTALTYMLVIRDPKRFEHRRAAAYLGLVPRRQQSGESDPQLPITRAGDRILRRLLVQCAHYIIGPFGKDSDLRRWGLQLVARRGAGAKSRAAIAVARKLANLLCALWKTTEVYKPLRQDAIPDAR